MSKATTLARPPRVRKLYLFGVVVCALVAETGWGSNGSPPTVVIDIDGDGIPEHATETSYALTVTLR
jgi:hypothetical protein